MQKQWELRLALTGTLVPETIHWLAFEFESKLVVVFDLGAVGKPRMDEYTRE